MQPLGGVSNHSRPNPPRRAHTNAANALGFNEDDDEIARAMERNVRAQPIPSNLGHGGDADIERAIMASMASEQSRNVGGSGGVDEDEELARVLEASRNMM